MTALELVMVKYLFIMLLLVIIEAVGLHKSLWMSKIVQMFFCLSSKVYLTGPHSKYLMTLTWSFAVGFEKQSVDGIWQLEFKFKYSN